MLAPPPASWPLPFGREIGGIASALLIVFLVIWALHTAWTRGWRATFKPRHGSIVVIGFTLLLIGQVP